MMTDMLRRRGLVCLAAVVVQCATGCANAPGKSVVASGVQPVKTASPIKHVIVIVGENHSFDNVYATYQPIAGNTIWNLLSQGIVTASGAPGKNFAMAAQFTATDTAPDSFLISPPKAPMGNVMPSPAVGGPKLSYFPPLATLSLAESTENGLDRDYYPYLLRGGTGQEADVIDTRIANYAALKPGPFQLTGPKLNYHDYSASPVHRFYQMWQQLDCDIKNATVLRPSGCDASLFSWVETSVGAGSNGQTIAQFDAAHKSPAADLRTGEGSTALGFYNMQMGDAPYFKMLADQFAMSDNFHQAVQGGTGTNHIMLGHGDLIWFSDGHGNPQVPPHNHAALANENSGTVDTIDTIENPDPQVGTNNWYTQDGYGGGGSGKPFYGGGSYTNCADLTQPGVATIAHYLQSLAPKIAPNCEPGHYYLLNNYNPGYFGNGANAYTDTNAKNTVFTIPPSSVPSIGDSLNLAGVSWKYYGDQWNNYVNDPYQINYGVPGPNSDGYCNICNPFQYDTSIMTNPAQVAAHIQDTTNLYADIAAGTLPAVSFVKPSGWVDGHPASSKLDLFEGFSKKIVDMVQANPALWSDTAIFITFDEGGGYYDSGYVQPLDYFGDGTRIPFIVVSSHVKPGTISHDYADLVSILKFIERNWGLAPVSQRSRDNFKNPVPRPDNPYVPANSPAIDDLFGLFQF